MKLTKEKLKQIIKEQLEAAQNESLGMGATPYELGYDAGYVNMPATVAILLYQKATRACSISATHHCDQITKAPVVQTLIIPEQKQRNIESNK